MMSAYSIACQHGYPYLRGEPMTIGGKVYSRHTKTGNPASEAIYIHVSDQEVHVLKGAVAEMAPGHWPGHHGSR